jgi:hypothetical protein
MYTTINNLRLAGACDHAHRKETMKLPIIANVGHLSLINQS